MNISIDFVTRLYATISDVLVVRLRVLLYMLKLKEQLLKIQKLRIKQASNLRNYIRARARTHTHTHTTPL